MEACHIFAITDPFFHKLWSWDKVIEILPKLKNVKAKWFAIETIGEVCSLGEESKSRLFEEVCLFGYKRLISTVRLHKYDFFFFSFRLINKT